MQAVLEPDGDGFGDETQDSCVGSAGTSSGCPPGSVSGAAPPGAPAASAPWCSWTTNGNGAMDSGEPTTTTDGSGAYEFGGLAPGAYNVVVVATGDKTCDTSCTRTVTVQGNTASVSFTVRTTVPAQPQPTAAVDLPSSGVVDHTKPILSPLSLSRTRFAIDPKGAAARPAVARGTTLKFSSSEAGTATFTISAVRPGKKSGKRCIGTSKPVKTRQRCTQTSVVAGFVARAVRGANTVAFSGRIRIGSRSKALSIGRYKVEPVVRDAAKNAPNRVHASFTIVK